MSKFQRLKRHLNTYWWLALLLPVIFLTLLVTHYSVHVPFWDQWELVTIFQKQGNGTLGWHDFWVQHNEHRILFPRIIMYILAQATHWDPYYETVVNLLLGVGILGMIILLLHRTHGKQRNFFIFTSIFASWLVLSPMSWENWMWGWQIQWYLSVLAVLVVLWCLTAKQVSRKLFLVAVLAATVATFSLANGLVIWLIGLGILLVRRSSLRRHAVWFGLFVVEAVLYYRGYINPPYHPSKTLFLHQPGGFLEYIFTYLGAPFSIFYRPALLFGIIVVLLMTASVAYIWHKQRKLLTTTLLPWLGLAAYALAGALTTAVSRLGLGIEQAYSSRYTTIALLFTLASFIVTYSALKLLLSKAPRVHQQLALAALLLFFVVPTALTYGKGIHVMREHSKQLRAARVCAEQAKTEDDPCLTLLYPSGPAVWNRLEYIRSQQLGGL